MPKSGTATSGNGAFSFTRACPAVLRHPLAAPTATSPKGLCISLLIAAEEPAARLRPRAGKGANMPEENTAADQQQQATAQAGGFEPITTQAALDEIIKARLTRERAKYAGFEDYKAKAAEYEAFKTTTGAELEAAKAALAGAQAELAAMKAQAERAAWDTQVSQETGLPLAIVADFAADSLEDLQAKAKRSAELMKAPMLPYDPADRKTYAPATAQTSRDKFGTFAAGLFK